jgi:hypothetical protein
MTDDIVAKLRNENGPNCTCFARSYYECGCEEAVWSEMFINDAADEIERLRKILRHVASNNPTWADSDMECRTCNDIIREFGR